MRDVTLSDIPGTVGSIRVVRTAKRKRRQWIYGTPKSDASTDRVVPLAPWLADELRDYLTNVHPFSPTSTQGMKYIPHAPLFPGRRNRYTFDWAKPVHAGSLHEHYFAQACRECGLGSVRFHDLRHTFATMNQMSDVASDASFSGKRERFLAGGLTFRPRSALGAVGSRDTPCSRGFGGLVASDARMLLRIRLRWVTG